MSKKPQLDNRCQHTSADGRRCRMRRMNGDPALCPQHRRQLLRGDTDPGAVAAELLGSIEDFKTAAAVNLALGRLFVMLAGNRIPPRNAAVLAYIGQLLLNTVGVLQHEIACAKELSGRELLRQILPSPRSPKSSGLAALAEAAQNKAPKVVMEVVCGPGCEDLADIFPKQAAPAQQSDKSRTPS